MKKTQVANAVSSAIDNASIASTIATNLLGEIALESEKMKLRDATNALVAKLHKDKVTVGRLGKNPCAVAYAFHSTLVAGGIAIGTASNYLTTFKNAVASGKPINDWNTQRTNGTKKGNAKGKGKSTLSNLLVKAFNHDDGKSFEELCKKVESQFEDAQFDSVYECFIDYLKSEGFEIKD
jgi:hypothetical protein